MLRERWKTVRDALEADIVSGALKPGDKLPTEPELAARFDVGRHSVRRAVEALAIDGKLSVEQGRGTFVEEARLITYTIGKRTRLRQNLRGQGLDPSGELLGAERLVAPEKVAAALGLAPGAVVIKSTRLSKADGAPIAYGALFHDADRFPDIFERRSVLGSVSEAYKSYGIDDYLRGETTIYARRARAEEARLLRQHPEQPVLVARATDVDLSGRPIGHSQVTWSAARIQFTLAQPGDDTDE